MSSPLKKINELVSFLPTEDIPFAKRFLQTHDYESLKELTWSALERFEKALEKGKNLDKYKDLDIDKIRELAVECSEYYYLIYPEELWDDNYDDNDFSVDEDAEV